MPKIHPSASVSRECELAESVEIGPYCVLDGPIRLDANVRLVGHVYLNGPLRVGEGTIVYPFAALGFPPQDFKFTLGMRTAGVVVGSGCILREHVTIHAATKADVPTRVGDRVFMMNSSHVAHDGQVGNDVVMVGFSGIAGHAQLGDRVTLGGASLIHQFTRVGRLAFVSGGSALSSDLPPFCLAWGRNMMPGLNLVGLRRNGVTRDHITLIRHAYRDVFRANLPRKEMVERLESLGKECPPLLEQAQFVRDAKRPICRAVDVKDAPQEDSEDAA
jgi:UDP-N-acetylglucosamine acyltransferase